MAKYNPNNEQHRKWLAEKVLTILLSYGYMMKFRAQKSPHDQEITFYKKVNGHTITVFTSIDERSRAMRHSGTDAIRVNAMEDYEGEWSIDHNRTRFHRVIHRRGSFKSIGDRLAEALRIANWNAENPEKPRWNGENRGKKRRKSKKYLTKKAK